jgi:ABC-type nickel/cobalt efflux system permease component RcnA
VTRHRRPARRAARRLLLAATLAGGLLLAAAGAAAAHPLGNFTVNTSSGLLVGPGAVTVDQVVDFAELPTFQERAGLDADGDGTVGAAERARWAGSRCAALAGAADGRLDGARLAFRSTAASATMTPAGAGLDVLRLECTLSAPIARADRARSLAWRSTAYTDRVGWHEVTAAGDGVTLRASDVPATSPSARLTAYPTDLLSEPVVQTRATVSFVPGGARHTAGRSGSAAPAFAPVDRAIATLTGLVTGRGDGAAAVLLAIGLAIALGALHAVAPGHGKTVMAAYLVGLRGTVRDAAVVGGTVTLTHTAGVLTLGLVLSTTRALAPERLYPLLGVASGLLLAALGVGVLRRTLARGRAHAHPGGHHHDHDHGHDHGHDHDHPHGHGHDHGAGRPRARDLVALGFAGGLSPSPSALVVLLGATAIGRAGLGAVLVLAYGVGMALTLTAAGLALVHARGLLGRVRGRPLPGWLAPARRVAPAGTAALIVLGGLGLAARAAIQL